MWEAWERLHMMREDHDIVNRTATGKKIGVKKMPKAPKRRSPSPAPAPVKYHKTYGIISEVRGVAVAFYRNATGPTFAVASADAPRLDRKEVPAASDDGYVQDDSKVRSSIVVR